jgi:hypothetical protein
MANDSFAINNLILKNVETHNSKDHDTSKTPEYLIQCSDFFESGVDGFDNASPCLWVEMGFAKTVKYDSSGKLSGDGKIINDDPVVCMNYGSWGPIIQQYMFEGTKIKAIGVKRFRSVEKHKEVIQELTYSTCLIKTYKQKGDTIIFTFCYVSLEDASVSFDHEGKKLGRTATMFDTISLKVTSKHG